MARRRKTDLAGWPEIVQQDGGLCVVFVNTESDLRQGLDSYADLLRWSVQCGAVSSAAAERLARTAGERPADAYVVWQQALELRDRLRRIFLALAAGEPLPAADVEKLNAGLSKALARRRLALATSGCRWVWSECGDDELDRMLARVIFSAADVLTTRYHRRVGRCAAQRCDLFFVDRTAGRRRKWCSRRCGNRIKALKHYHLRIKPRKEQKRQEDLARARRSERAKEAALARLARLEQEMEGRSQEETGADAEKTTP